MTTTCDLAPCPVRNAHLADLIRDRPSDDPALIEVFRDFEVQVAKPQVERRLSLTQWVVRSITALE